MTVAVSLNLAVKVVQINFQNGTIDMSFTTNKIGQAGSASLEANTDFTPAQLVNLQAQMEALFAKWVARQ